VYEHLALSDSGFLFDTRTGDTYSLNRSGTLLLRALMAGASEAELVDRLVETFEVDRPTARRDVAQFLLRLRDLRLVGDAEAA